jgi:ribonuclease Z
LQDIRIIFLGTGAGMPTRARNVAAVALVMDGRVLLFDCGEATQHQLMRSPLRFGAIEAIFISHLHGDHLFGLPGLLASMSLNAREAPLALYGPSGITAFMHSLPLYHTSFDVEIHELAPGRARRANGYTVDAAPLAHSAPCFGFCVVEDDRPGEFDVTRAQALGLPPGPLYGRLQRGETVGDIKPSHVLGPARPGRRVVYVTDTRPCEAAVELARGADVLIHESTYAEEMAEEARERTHATAGEAAEIARRAGVKQLILTHVSPRYGDASRLLEEARAIFPQTMLAEDFACFDAVRSVYSAGSELSAMPRHVLP